MGQFQLIHHRHHQDAHPLSWKRHQHRSGNHRTNSCPIISLVTQRMKKNKTFPPLCQPHQSQNQPLLMVTTRQSNLPIKRFPQLARLPLHPRTAGIKRGRCHHRQPPTYTGSAWYAYSLASASLLILCVLRMHAYMHVLVQLYHMINLAQDVSVLQAKSRRIPQVFKGGHGTLQN